jgi:hypothetical protein
MPGSPAEVKLVSNAMANATRRKIMAMLVEKERTTTGNQLKARPLPGRS